MRIYLITNRIQGDVEVLITDCGLSLSEDPNYEFSCALCDKRLVNMAVAIEHAATAKHQRMLEYEYGGNTSCYEASQVDQKFDVLDQNVIMRSTNAEELGKCLLCRVVLHDLYTVGVHVASNRHRNNLNWYQQVHAAMALKRFMSITETHPRCQKIPYEEDSYAALRPFPEFIIDEKTVRFIRDLPDGIVVREWDYYCLYCDSKALAEDQLHAHVQGHHRKVIQNHKSTTKRQDSPKPVVKTKVDSDWQTAVQNGSIPPPPLNRRPIHSGTVRDI